MHSTTAQDSIPNPVNGILRITHCSEIMVKFSTRFFNGIAAMVVGPPLEGIQCYASSSCLWVGAASVGESLLRHLLNNLGLLSLCRSFRR
jgi:hypothetical protein